MSVRILLAAAALASAAATAQATPVHYTAPSPGGQCWGVWYGKEEGTAYLSGNLDFTYDAATGALSIASWTTYTTDGQLLYSLPPLSATLTAPYIGAGVSTHVSPGEVRLITMPERHWFSLEIIFYPTTYGVDPTTTQSLSPLYAPSEWHLHHMSAAAATPEPASALLAVAALGGVALVRRRGLWFA